MKVAPSILTADFLHLKQELKSIETADRFHIDIMDGNFVPNISFGPYITKLANNSTNVPLDIHLMVDWPDFWIDKFNLSNTYNITFHFEAKSDILKTIAKIKETGKKVGISIKPKTEVIEIHTLLKEIDLVLVMSVEPGFGGQKFIESALGKIKELKTYRKKYGLNFEIEVDGGVDFSNIEKIKEAGADIVVAGSYIFNQKDRKAAINSLK